MYIFRSNIHLCQTEIRLSPNKYIAIMLLNFSCDILQHKLTFDENYTN